MKSVNIAESYRFDAWGKVTGIYDENGNHLAESAYENRFLWQGREYSYRTGLYYFRARWYGPVMGRWLSNDPIGISGGLNQYVFCGNNPVNGKDPDGNNAVLIGAGLIALNIGAWSQVSVDIQHVLFDTEAINAELKNNFETIEMLRKVIASNGAIEWPDNFGKVGQLGTNLEPQGEVCKKRQKVRNTFESLRNIRGLPSASRELAARLALRAIQPLPKNMSPEYRLELAKALLSRQLSFRSS